MQRDAESPYNKSNGSDLPCAGSVQRGSAVTTVRGYFTVSLHVVIHRKCTFACLQTLWPQYSPKHARPSQDTLPSSNSSKSSTKNSFRGGRFGLFRVFSSCWILEDTLLFTGTPVKERAGKDWVMPWPREHAPGMRSDEQLFSGAGTTVDPGAGPVSHVRLCPSI